MDIIVNQKLMKNGGMFGRLVFDDIVIEIKPKNESLKGSRQKSHFEEMLCALPMEFSNEDVAKELKKYNMKTPARQVIYKWVRCNMVEKIELRKFRKIV